MERRWPKQFRKRFPIAEPPSLRNRPLFLQISRPMLERFLNGRQFVRKLRWEGESQDLASVCKAISKFLSPPAAAALEGYPFRGLWRNAGPWTDAD